MHFLKPKTIRNSNQQGFGHILFLVGVVVIVAIGAIGYRVYTETSASTLTRITADKNKYFDQFVFSDGTNGLVHVTGQSTETGTTVLCDGTYDIRLQYSPTPDVESSWQDIAILEGTSDQCQSEKPFTISFDASFTAERTLYIRSMQKPTDDAADWQKVGSTILLTKK